MLTEQKIKEIHQLSIDDAVQLLQELVERIGVVSQSDYVKIMDFKQSRTELNRKMDSKIIKNVKIGGIRFPIIND